jgi:cbb3-type cytochrome oxidase maturation protein
MNILVLLIFISLIFVLLGIILFVFSVKNKDLDQAEQLSLKPIEDE